MDTRECGVFNPLSFGLALGLLLALSVVSVGVVSGLFGVQLGLFHSLSSVYVGSPDVVGILIGAVLAFVDAFVGGVILAYLYNFFLKRV